MSDAVGFGIIGCGVIAPWHVAGIKGSSNARLVAVCDIIPEKAEKLAAENGNPRVCTDHRKLLEDPEVQAVCVCTPSGLHAKVGIDAAQAGKHVLSEKPIDITLENIDAFIAETKKAGVNLGCIFQRRTQPLWIAVHDAVQGGKLGKMVLADAYIKYYRSQEYYDSAGWRGTWEMDGGGALMNQGVRRQAGARRHVVEIGTKRRRHRGEREKSNMERIESTSILHHRQRPACRR